MVDLLATDPYRISVLDRDIECREVRRLACRHWVEAGVKSALCRRARSLEGCLCGAMIFLNEHKLDDVPNDSGEVAWRKGQASALTDNDEVGFA